MVTVLKGYSQGTMRHTGLVTYLPLDGKPIRLTLGLRALDPQQWIEVDHHRADELCRKLQLLADQHDVVVATLPEGDAGSRECWHRLSEHVVTEFPEFYTDIERDDSGIVAMTDIQTGVRVDIGALHPIDACGRIVQEDVAVMRKIESKWVLVAASLCFPSRWKLSEKIGRDLEGIHAPVPDYQDQIGRPVEVMFDKIDVGRPMWRLNWTLIDDPELHQPVATGRWEHALAAGSKPDPGQLLHFRVERQTLTKLPHSGDVVFTIRTYVRPLAELGGPAVFADLATALRSAGPDLLAYKGWSPLLGETLAWLDAHA